MDSAKDVELPGNVIAGLYSKTAMDRFIAKIKAIPELKADLTNAKIDTITDATMLLRKLANGESERIPFDKGFSTNVFLVLAANTNAAPKWEVRENSFGFNLKKCDPTDIWLFKDMELWNYHTGEYGPSQRFDSIRKDEVKELKAVVEAEQAIFKDVRYIVMVCDALLKMPKLLDDHTFEGGLLVTEVKVFDLATGSKVGQGTLVAKNTEEIPDYSSALGDEGKEAVLLEDLLRSRNIEVADFLQNKKGDEPEAENSQLKKTFTNNRDYYNNR